MLVQSSRQSSPPLSEWPDTGVGARCILASTSGKGLRWLGTLEGPGFPWPVWVGHLASYCPDKAGRCLSIPCGAGAALCLELRVGMVRGCFPPLLAQRPGALV